METKSFYLLRHGEYENPTDVFIGRLPAVLSSVGRERIERVALELRDKGIRRIFTSAVERCRETSEILAEALSVEIHTDKRLLEHMSPIQGMPLDDYRKDRNLRFTMVDLLGGETMMDVQVRMLDFFYEKMKDEEGSIVICSHGDPLYFLYCGLAGKDLPKDAMSIDRSQYQPKGSFRKVDIEGDRFSIEDIILL